MPCYKLVKKGSEQVGGTTTLLRDQCKKKKPLWQKKNFNPTGGKKIVQSKTWKPVFTKEKKMYKGEKTPSGGIPRDQGEGGSLGGGHSNTRKNGSPMVR